MGRTKTASAYLVVVLAVILMPGGLVLGNVVQQKINEGVASQVQLPDPLTSSYVSYTHWVSNDYDGAPAIYTSFYLWNLTNPQEFLAGGEKPVFIEVGPFVFREFRYKYDIRFSDDRSQVTYKEFTKYVQVGGINASQVKITNINPGFLGSVATAGGTDLDLVHVMFPMTLTTVKEVFERTYTESFEAKTYRSILRLNQTNTNYVTNNVTLVQGSVWNLKASDNKYLEFVSNKTSLSFDIIAQFDSAKALIPLNLGIESSLNATVRKLELWAFNYTSHNFVKLGNINNTGERTYLFNFQTASSDYFNQTNGHGTLRLRFIGLNYTYKSNYRLKIDCINATLVQPGYDSLTSAIVDLGYPFPTPEQVFFEEWANNYYPAPDLSMVPPDINNSFVIAIVRAVGAQTVHAEGSETGEGVDIDGRSPYNYPGSYADLNISDYNVQQSGITQTQCRDIWARNNPNSLTGMNFEKNRTWFEAAVGNTTSINFLKSAFGLNDSQLGYVLRWINVSCTTWAKNVGEYTLNEWNSGLVVCRSVSEWLFTANDTAIYNHQAYYNEDLRRGLIGFFDDFRDQSEAEAAVPPHSVPSFTVKTGRDNIGNTRQITEYDGMDTIRIWAEPVKVEGTDGMQFAPGVARNETLKTFQPDLMRVAKMEYSRDAKTYGISLMRFSLSSDTFAVNPAYYMNTEGLINLSPVSKYSGAPVRLSRPHFLGADPSLLSAVIGMSPDPEKHDTFVDVEPATGIVMNASKRIQINFEVTPSEFYRKNINDTVIPVAWLEQKGEIPQDLAVQFKDQLYSAMNLRDSLPMACIGIGVTLFLLGAIALTRARRQRVISKKGSSRRI